MKGRISRLRSQVAMAASLSSGHCSSSSESSPPRHPLPHPRPPTGQRYQKIWSLVGVPSGADVDTVSRLMPALVQAIGEGRAGHGGARRPCWCRRKVSECKAGQIKMQEDYGAGEG